MKNPDFFAKLRDLCITALNLLSSKYATPDSLPWTMKSRFILSNGVCSQTWDNVVEWIIPVLTNLEEIKTLPQFHEFENAAKVDAEISRHLDTMVGTRDSQRRCDLDAILQSILVSLLAAQNGFPFQEETLRNIYACVEGFFYQGKFNYTYLALLRGFKADDDSIQLNPDMAIVKTTIEQRNEIVRYAAYFPSEMFNEYAIELSVSVDKIIGQFAASVNPELYPSFVIRQRLEQACSALRLFKKGAVSIGPMLLKPAAWEFPCVFIPGPIHQVIDGTEYSLNKQEAADFREFWSSLKAAQSRDLKRIKIALIRLDFGYERKRAEDKLIDYFVAFEALFMEGDQRQELSFRLCLMAAALLGKTADQRKKIFEDMKTGYRFRSKVVHGTSIPETVRLHDGQQIRLVQFVDIIEEHLRSAIKEFARNCKVSSESKVLGALREKVVCGGFNDEH